MREMYMQWKWVRAFVRGPAGGATIAIALLLRFVDVFMCSCVHVFMCSCCSCVDVHVFMFMCCVDVLMC